MNKLTPAQWLKIIEKSPTLKKVITSSVVICSVMVFLVWTCKDYQYEEVISETASSKIKDNVDKSNYSKNNKSENRTSSDGIYIKGKWLKYDEYYGRDTWMYIKTKKANVRDYPDLRKSKVVDTYDQQGMTFAPLGMINDFYIMIPIYEGGEHQFIHKSIVAKNKEELFNSYLSQKITCEGMTKAQVKKAWGAPDTEYDQGNYSSWKYDWHNRIVTITFIDGIYTEKSEFKHNYDDY